MTREQFFSIAELLRETYGRDKLITSKPAFDLWFDFLADLTFEEVRAAALTYISNEHFPPHQGDIRRYAMKLRNVATEERSEGEAWLLVRKAIANGIYNSEAMFNRLPADIQKAVGTHEQIRIWAMDPDFNEGVEQSQFLRSYRIVQERKKERAMIPEAIYAQLEQRMEAARKLAQNNEPLLADCEG